MMLVFFCFALRLHASFDRGGGWTGDPAKHSLVVCVEAAAWVVFVAQVGHPTNDFRVLAALPPDVIEAALENPRNGCSYLPVMQATQVGQAYKLARRNSWVLGCGGAMWEDWVEVSLCSPGSSTTPTAASASPTVAPTGLRRGNSK